LGEACPKGWEALTPLKAPDRAKTPYLRDKSGKLVPVSWETALVAFVERFTKIQEKYGKESVAFLSTGQICTEEMALLGVLAKFGMGILHCDSNTRQCMATSAVAYKQSFGFDAPPYTYKDFEESDVIVFIGANPSIAHPILWQRVCMNKNKPEIIVIDPRTTETALAATRHYAITPKSDLTLFYGLAHIIIEKNWINKSYIAEHTNGFEEFKAHVKRFTPTMVSEASGLSLRQLNELASLISLGKRVSFWWTMGVNQSHEGVRTAQAIINLALMTGNIGRPGTGANSITGQCNAMGSRIFANITNLLAGHDFLNPEHRRKIAEILNIDPKLIPAQNSLAYDQILDQIPVNKIKGLWVIATNPAHSWINQTEFRAIMRQLDFLVVQDMYHTTEMAKMADLILPAAGWGEKDGTLINSERRIGLVKKVAQAPGQALADFYIFKLIAQYWGCGKLFEEWSSPEAAFQILKKVSRGMPCDISGIKDYQMIEEQGGIQWPFPEGTDTKDKERRLFEDGKFYHPDGRAKFIFEDVRQVPEPIEKNYPFKLLTGRGTSAQWHTQTRTGKSAILRQLYPSEIYVEINPNDAQQLNIQQNQWVFVCTKRGQLKARANLSATVKPGEIFIPMHYEETNRLTFPAFDPYSRQPSYKICAARVSSNPYY
jgi:assimilatory nitrate reductase catalytic subunit